eukprot:6881994-Karenia_brevis.AAC.1
MRKALHIHMLVQLHGFSHPSDLITSGKLADVFRRIWFFVASICFRSVEGFGSYLNERAAMDVLKVKPLLPVNTKQKNLIGENRAHEAIAAQKKAREVTTYHPATDEDRLVR